ncbi:hypothetical protein [Candidatus Manganitrophus noduliformans]|uniref:Uncharacterized protein n=1 Tax=Candidatus Manganitrophus noduliformans TaxID=2606439 RepID=A0A7X6DSA8_9BACT|nr:hypothetical protein [Candidatus Manganitrophus noduliformans]NKE72477.1 hypothetical protein [Candidatus Manganitrophus noduliformans]
MKGRWFWILIIAASLTLPPHPSFGQESRLSIAYTTGVYQPSLKSLNKILGDPHLAILQDPNYLLPRNRLLPAEVRNIVAPEITGKTNYGAEIQWEATDKFSLVATLSLWQGESTAEDVITTFLRQDLPPVSAPRTAAYNLSVTQIWLGWKYNLYQDPDHGRFFINVGLIGISIANLMIDSVVRVNSPDLNFASVSSTEAEGIAFTSRIGIGGEYFITSWLSFGVNANYVIGSSAKVKVKKHFRSSFFDIPPPPPETTNLQNVPPVPENGETLRWARIETQNISDFCDPPATTEGGNIDPDTCSQHGRGNPAGRPLELELNGFQVTGMLRFYF